LSHADRLDFSDSADQPPVVAQQLRSAPAHSLEATDEPSLASYGLGVRVAAGPAAVSRLVSRKPAGMDCQQRSGVIAPSDTAWNVYEG